MTNPRALATHLRRYPWWYGTAVVWLVALVALPIVHVDPLGALTPDGRANPSATAEVTSPTALPDLGFGTGPGGVGGGGAIGGTVTTTVDGSVVGAVTTTTKPGSLELVPPALLDLVFDAIPEIVFPPLPDELAPVARALAPLAATGCTAVGLAGVVVAVAAQSANGVPVQRILPYLSPLSTACASFPIPVHHTVCEADAPFVIDLGGLAKTPPILGLGIDEVQQTQILLERAFGQPVPDLAASLREQLHCTIT